MSSSWLSFKFPPGRHPRSSLIPMLVPVVAVFAQAYLISSQSSPGSNRSLRKALWVIGLVCCLYVLIFVRLPELEQRGNNVWIAFDYINELLIVSTRCGLGKSLPPLQPGVRAKGNLKSAWDLLTGRRMVGYVGGSAVERTGRTRLQHLLYHVFGCAQHVFWLDVVTWPIWRLDPGGIGSLKGGDVDAVAGALAVTYGLPPWFVRTILLAAPGFIIYHCLAFEIHTIAILSIALGSNGDEWPTFFRTPWKATSIMEFWQRWHNMYKSNYIWFVSHLPRSTPKIISMMAVFVISGLHHWLGFLVVEPVARISPLDIMRSNYLLVFALSSCAAATEVSYKRATGRKVGGWMGRLWMWSFLLSMGHLWSRPQYASGLALAPRQLFVDVPALSLVEQGAKALGYGR